MKTSSPKTISIFLILVILVSACGKTTGPELTATPEATATPIPPTPTASPEEILSEAWQAYEAQEYETARSIAEEVRDATKAAGDESGEALALIGLVQMKQGTSGTALYYLEEAWELGYESEALIDALVSVYLQQVENRIGLLDKKYNPDSILSEIFHAQEILTKLESLAPEDPKVKEFAAILHIKEFDPADYVEIDLNLNEIENLLTRLDNGDLLNFSSSYFVNLKEEHPQNPVTLFFYALQMFFEDDYEEAIELLKASTEIEPGNFRSWELLGHVYHQVGMMSHARDAYINSLILNPDNEDAYERLASLSWREGWINDGFESVGFSIQHFPDERYKKIGETSKSSGVIQSENANLNLFTQITWQPDGGDSSLSSLQDQMTGAIDASSPGFKSTFKPFPFSPMPMIYRDYAYRLPGSSTYADAVIAGVQCSGINYIFDFRFTVDGEDHEWLHFLLALYLETFICE